MGSEINELMDMLTEEQSELLLSELVADWMLERLKNRRETKGKSDWVNCKPQYLQEKFIEHFYQSNRWDLDNINDMINYLAMISVTLRKEELNTT